MIDAVVNGLLWVINLCYGFCHNYWVVLFFDEGHISAFVGMGAEELDQDNTYAAGDEAYQVDLFW